MKNPNEEGGNNHDEREKNRAKGHQIFQQWGQAGSKNLTEFAPGMNALELRYGAEYTKHLREELAKIDSTEENSIGSLAHRGELPADVEKISMELDKYGVDASNLTVPEAKDVYDYATNATEEIVKAKTDRIYDALSRHINGVRNRHDGQEPAFYNERETEWKDEVRDRYLDWERGDLDTERGFNVDEAYDRLVEEGYEPSMALRRHLEEEDIEDLYDEGLIDESSMYAYGPFTKGDLDEISIFEDRTWTDITNDRYLSGASEDLGKSLSTLLKKTIISRNNSIEEDLLYDHIANEVLQKRRLNAKDLTMVAPVIALESLSVKAAEGAEQKIEHEKMQRSTRYVAYYLAKIFDRSSEEMKHRFDSTRPLSKEFFEEMIAEAKSLTESRAEYIDKSQRPYLTKLDEHLHRLLNGLGAVSTQSEIFASESEEYD